MGATDVAAASLGELALGVAMRELGVRESPPGSNRTLFGRWFGEDGVPWCAIFASYCYAKGAGITLCSGWHGPGVTSRGVSFVPTLEAWLRATDRWLDKDEPPWRGDLVIFDWDGGEPDHVGFVERRLGRGRFATVEGNTGGAVMRRERSVAQVAGFGRV
ncbi:MAG TPA: CHAP domain-containing protein [Gaiellaceae bacterium]|nr:CHAP domain-containing protein [Gaiellaceae bacterium]